MNHTEVVEQWEYSKTVAKNYGLNLTLEFEGPFRLSWFNGVVVFSSDSITDIRRYINSYVNKVCEITKEIK